MSFLWSLYLTPIGNIFGFQWICSAIERRTERKKKHIEVISRCFYCTRHTAKRFLLEATVNCSNLYWFSGDPNSPSITRMPQFHDTYCVKYMCSCTTCGSNSELKHSCSYLLSVFLVSARYLLPLLYANCLSILRQSWHTWSLFFPSLFSISSNIVLHFHYIYITLVQFE